MVHSNVSCLHISSNVILQYFNLYAPFFISDDKLNLSVIHSYLICKLSEKLSVIFQIWKIIVPMKNKTVDYV